MRDWGFKPLQPCQPLKKPLVTPLHPNKIPIGERYQVGWGKEIKLEPSLDVQSNTKKRKSYYLTFYLCPWNPCAPLWGRSDLGILRFDVGSTISVKWFTLKSFLFLFLPLKPCFLCLKLWPLLLLSLSLLLLLLLLLSRRATTRVNKALLLLQNDQLTWLTI